MNQVTAKKNHDYYKPTPWKIYIPARSELFLIEKNTQ